MYPADFKRLLNSELEFYQMTKSKGHNQKQLNRGTSAGEKIKGNKQKWEMENLFIVGPWRRVAPQTSEGAECKVNCSFKIANSDLIVRIGSDWISIRFIPPNVPLVQYCLVDQPFALLMSCKATSTN